MIFLKYKLAYTKLIPEFASKETIIVSFIKDHARNNYMYYLYNVLKFKSH